VNQSLVKAVACALCEVRGHDPAQKVVAGSPYQIDGKQFAAVNSFSEPVQLWEHYQADAEAAIKAVALHMAPARA